jgi:altronate hydrolase
MIIHPSDNVEIRDNGHKYARKDICCGEKVIKYGMPIGSAVCNIAAGEHVHTHNCKTDLAGQLEYTYTPDFVIPEKACSRTFMGFRRADGQVGVRNDIWVIPTVACVNKLARKLADSVDGVALEHPYGCSQLGEDHETTANVLAALAHNPNAGGVLVVALGCENNTLESFKKRLNDYSKLNIEFLLAQDAGDEYLAGLELLKKLQANAVKERVEIPVSELKIGLKCGGSDGFSGLTANPLCGRFSDWLVSQGGTTVLTEVPEMFGAETLLFNRCINEKVFEKAVKMVNDFKNYYEKHDQVIYENPSPGNKAGGITTLEDKSLGCVQKGGSSPVMDVLAYGEQLKTPGLNLLSGPGNDPIAATALAAAGCHLMLFTTGRGTPFGSVIPTIKVATNTAMAEAKANWIDYDAMKNPDTEAFADYIIEVASGNLKTANEKNFYREIAIFKSGVTL